MSDPLFACVKIMLTITKIRTFSASCFKIIQINHFASLGIILGVATAYIFGSYQLEARRAAEASELAVSAAVEAHTDISDEEMLSLFDQALAIDPNNQELNTRYANFLFNLQRFAQAVELYQGVLKNDPENSKVRTDMATAIYNLGKVDEAIVQYERSLLSDSSNILALHNVVLAQLDALGNIDAAEATIRRIEAIDPSYPGLNSLRQRLASISANSGN